MKQLSKGLLISVEGLDGSGKTTLAHKLIEALQDKGHNSLLTQEPGGTQLGQNLRNILHNQKETVCDQAEYLLFAADRAQHVTQIIIPALKQNTLVISDRLADSSLAYQGYGRGVDKTMIIKINSWAMQGIKPDLTLYLKIGPEKIFDRIEQRKEKLTSFEREKIDFWKRVQAGYEEIFVQRTNVVTLDGMLEPETLCQQASDEILKLISS